jgi:hypothetical protein
MSGSSSDELRKAGESLQKAAGAALGSAQQAAGQAAQQAKEAVKNLKVRDKGEGWLREEGSVIRQFV